MNHLSTRQRPQFLQGVLLVSLLAIAVFSATAAWAIPEHEAEELQLNDSLTLSALLDITLERHPQTGVMVARSATADAETRFARRLLPDATSLSALHWSDRSFDDIGAYENEVTISFPMWLPGEKKAQSRLGDILSTVRTSDQDELRWRVSGLLRQQLWQVKLTVRQWQLAFEQEQRLAEVLAQVTLFAESGELSRADQLATMEELAIWKGETMMLEAEYMDAIRLYHSFTGMETFPAQVEETLSGLTAIEEHHPALKRAMDQLAKSTAATDVVRESSNLRPSVDVFWRGFRGDRHTPAVDALGVGFAIPLGKSPRREASVAEAFEEVAAAQAGLQETKRLLELQLHEANHALHVARERLENSNAMMKAATERHQLDKLSFELGEFSTREWLRRLTRFKEIERSHELLLIQREAAIAAYNQAVGETL